MSNETNGTNEPKEPDEPQQVRKTGNTALDRMLAYSAARQRVARNKSNTQEIRGSLQNMLDLMMEETDTALLRHYYRSARYMLNDLQASQLADMRIAKRNNT